MNKGNVKIPTMALKLGKAAIQAPCESETGNSDLLLFKYGKAGDDQTFMILLSMYMIKAVKKLSFIYF